MKYTIYSTKEDWNKLYDEARELGANEIDIKIMKKSQSYDAMLTWVRTNQRRAKELATGK